MGTAPRLALRQADVPAHCSLVRAAARDRAMPELPTTTTIARLEVADVKAITLTQPWATLVAIGEKRIETRSWQTEHRGPIAIHAAKGMTQADYSVCREHPFSTALHKHGITRISQLPRGAIIATARLLTVVKLPAAAAPAEGTWEHAFGDYSKGRYIWILDEIRALEVPVPARGMLQLWDWNVE